MRILVIFTGGTIESSKQDGWVSLDATRKEKLLEEYLEKHQADVEFETVTPFTIHSENLTAERLSDLMACLCEQVQKPYDGIIVTHGTDTLQYSAAAAAFCLGNTSVPVVFVSSNYPLEDPRANGALHFEGAVEWIRSGKGRGVLVAYSNDGRQVEFHYAERVFYHPELSDHVCSVSTPPMFYQNGAIHLRQTSVVDPKAKPCGAVRFCQNPSILNVTVTPFEQYDYDPKKYRAAVLAPYHSGTLNTANPAFVDFCRRFAQAGVPVFLPDVPSSSAYDSMREYGALGITVLPEMARIPLLVKLWIAVSLQQDIRTFISTPIGRELPQM